MRSNGYLSHSPSDSSNGNWLNPNSTVQHLAFSFLSYFFVFKINAISPSHFIKIKFVFSESLALHWMRRISPEKAREKSILL